MRSVLISGVLAAGWRRRRAEDGGGIPEPGGPSRAVESLLNCHSGENMGDDRTAGKDEMESEIAGRREDRMPKSRRLPAAKREGGRPDEGANIQPPSAA